MMEMSPEIQRIVEEAERRIREAACDAELQREISRQNRDGVNDPFALIRISEAFAPTTH